MKWTVGQEVHMLSGNYIAKGKVVEVNPSGAVVQKFPWPWIAGVNQGGKLYHFDNHGRQLDDGNGWDQYGPWVIDEMPFAERTVWLEGKEKRKGKKWGGVDLDRQTKWTCDDPRVSQLFEREGDWVYFLTDPYLRRGIVIELTPTRVVVAEMEEDDGGMPGPGTFAAVRRMREIGLKWEREWVLDRKILGLA